MSKNRKSRNPRIRTLSVRGRKKKVMKLSGAFVNNHLPGIVVVENLLGPGGNNHAETRYRNTADPPHDRRQCTMHMKAYIPENGHDKRGTEGARHPGKVSEKEHRGNGLFGSIELIS